MRHPLLIFALFLFTLPAQAAVEVYTPAEVIYQHIPSRVNIKMDKEARRALRQEFKKARKAARAEGKKPQGLAITGFIFALLSFLLMFRGVIFPGVVIGSGIFTGVFFLGGIILSAVAFSWIKKGKIESKFKWMPITSFILAGIQVLLIIAAFAFLALIF